MQTVKSPPFLSTGDLGDTLGVQSWRISRLFELGVLPEPQRIGNRRLIPKSMVPEIVDALRDRGWLPPHPEQENPEKIRQEPAPCE